MSAYGALLRSTPSVTLPSTSWSVASKHNDSATPRSSVLTIHHLTLDTAEKLSGLVDYLYQEFADEIQRGQTYPQETCASREVFEAYFFAADVFVGVLGEPSNDIDSNREDGTEIEIEIEEIRKGRDWKECLVGFYYIKPNYPGRSSHICNAGFITPPAHRRRGYATTLARSYLHYAPRLGYQASVFNLVYVNNVASVRTWENLGFIRAGLIPRAGRLKTKDGSGEEYVDAYVFYKSFDTPTLQ